MADSSSRLEYLISGFAADELNSAELDELLALVPGPEAGDGVLFSVEQALNNHTGPLLLTPEAKQHLLEQILSRRTLTEPVPNMSGRTVHRVHFLKTVWFRYAAAIIILLTGFSVYLLYPKKQHTEVASVSPSRVLPDVLPGSNKAVLTLADGHQITLDSTNNELLNAKGITNKNALIAYSGKDVPDAINTLTTPKGGQYQLRLPDGTMVWLNAASSITYPTTFTGQNRKVSITGEAYFEVTKNKEKPFIVQFSNQKIEVLGTHFNVNAYTNESTTKTALLEGSIKVDNVVLKPGQAYANGKISESDLQQDVAWKNGVFNFTNIGLNAAMRQIERWYDVQVVFKGNIPVLELEGKLPRTFTLQQVLAAFGDIGLRYSLTGKQLIISP